MICDANQTEPITTPFTIGIDKREKLPYAFEGHRADAKDGYAPLLVKTEIVHLKTADYSLVDMESEVGIERKSFEDLFGSLGGGRTRFEAELERLDRMSFSAVIVEASLHDIAHYSPVHSKMSPKAVVRSIVAFSVRHRTKWFFAGNRQLAEALTLRLLQRYWLDAQKEAAK